MNEHPALKNLYNEVIEGKYSWDRWGLLGILSDYFLNYTQGHILEIGCGESSIYLSKLAEKYDRTCYHCEYSRSGVENMKNTKGYFGYKSIVFTGKSDDFFKDLGSQLPKIALAFIDGDHEYEQVKKDFWNTWKSIVKGGVVFLHDTSPPNDSWKVPEKCGTVYRLREDLELSDFNIFTFTKSSFGVGLTMVQK